jgi:hypothetical protein
MDSLMRGGVEGFLEVYFFGINFITNDLYTQLLRMVRRSE